jgi:hypothetical protein
LLWLFNLQVAVLLVRQWHGGIVIAVVGGRRRAASTSALAKGEETGSVVVTLHAGASSGDPVCHHFIGLVYQHIYVYTPHKQLNQ